MEFLNFIVEHVLVSSLPDRYCRVDGALEIVNEWTDLAVNEERLTGHLLLTHGVENLGILKAGCDEMFRSFKSS